MICRSSNSSDGTKYNYNHQEKEYARIEKGAFAPEYFSSMIYSLRGDANGDDRVDMDDVSFVTDIILGAEKTTEAADVNVDGIVSMSDVMFIVNHILNDNFPDE